MPRWARFLSCSFTSLIVSLVGFLLAANWYEGGPRFWPQLMDFFSTNAFWSLVWLFALLGAVTLVIARIAVNLYGLPDSVAGLLAGGAIALVYATFLIASHVGDWGGVALGVQRTWVAGALFAVPFATAGAFTTWLWDRLD